MDVPEEIIFKNKWIDKKQIKNNLKNYKNSDYEAYLKKFLNLMTEIIKTPIKDLFIVKPKVFSDNRGFFFESYNSLGFNKEIGSDIVFVQDNHSFSKKNVLRGLHFQLNKPQGKLIRVCNGSIFDVAVDLRKDSKTYLKWFGCELSKENRNQLWIPPGFAQNCLSFRYC